MKRTGRYASRATKTANLLRALANFTVHRPKCPKNDPKIPGGVVLGETCACGLDDVKSILHPMLAKLEKS